MLNKRYVVLGFDMETDCGSWSPFYNGLLKGTPKILKLLKIKNINATFFFTGESAQKHPEVISEVLDFNSNHEIGCHSLYHETVGDPIFEIPGIKPLLPDEIENRLRFATKLVEQAAGQKPTSFRAPRLWGSTKVVNVLDELGYLADASYPLYFYEKQLVPYHPSKENWLEKGDLRIVEIPNFADMTIDSKDKYHRDRDQWPIFRIKGAKELLTHIDNFIGYVNNRGLPVVLCFYFHPWEFVEMPEKFKYGEGTVMPDSFIVENCGSYALEQLEILIDNLLEQEVIFYTARDIATKLTW